MQIVKKLTKEKILSNMNNDNQTPKRLFSKCSTQMGSIGFVIEYTPEQLQSVNSEYPNILINPGCVPSRITNLEEILRNLEQ